MIDDKLVLKVCKGMDKNALWSGRSYVEGNEVKKYLQEHPGCLNKKSLPKDNSKQMSLSL